MRVVARTLEPFKHGRTGLDASALSSAGSEHTGIKVVILQLEVPLNEWHRAFGFDELRKNCPKPAARGVFNADKCSRAPNMHQDEDCRLVNLFWRPAPDALHWAESLACRTVHRHCAKALPLLLGEAVHETCYTYRNVEPIAWRRQILLQENVDCGRVV